MKNDSQSAVFSPSPFLFQVSGFPEDDVQFRECCDSLSAPGVRHYGSRMKNYGVCITLPLNHLSDTRDKSFN